jgi:hypothetical protein
MRIRLRVRGGGTPISRIQRDEGDALTSGRPRRAGPAAGATTIFFLFVFCSHFLLYFCTFHYTFKYSTSYMCILHSSKDILQMMNKY